MGRLVAETVSRSSARLVGGTLGKTSAGQGVQVFGSIAELASECDVVIDFSAAGAAIEHAACLGASRLSPAWVLGTTGLAADAVLAVRRAAKTIVVIQAANFAPGVTLVLAVAERLARALPAVDYDAEISEMHHRNKVDAPSGTAWAIGEAVSAGRGVHLADAAECVRHGQTGPRRLGTIGFTALRGGQVVGDHTLLFAGDDEQIGLTHRAMDRAVFARGALQAALWTRARPPGLYGMADVLGLTDDFFRGPPRP